MKSFSLVPIVIVGNSSSRKDIDNSRDGIATAETLATSGIPGYVL
jgi:hypothetical protein